MAINSIDQADLEGESEVGVPEIVQLSLEQADRGQKAVVRNRLDVVLAVVAVVVASTVTNSHLSTPWS